MRIACNSSNRSSRSVGGKRCPRNMNAYAADGTSSSSIFIRQSAPNCVIAKLRTPPMTMPPGNQACSVTSRWVLSFE